MDTPTSLPAENGVHVWRAAVIMPIFTFIFVALRFYWQFQTRVGGIKSLGLDDYLVAATFVVIIVHAILMCFATYNGMGLHIWQYTPELNSRYYLWIGISSEFYTLALMGFKTTLLVIYLQLFGVNRKFAWACYITMFCTVAYLFCNMLTEFLGCNPIAKKWNQQLPGQCINSIGANIAYGAGHMLSDLTIAILPLVMVWRLKFPTRQQKLGLSAALGIGFVAWAVATARWGIATYNMVSYDRPWWAGVSFTLSILEVNTGLICACVITTSPLLTGKAAKRKKASQGSSHPSDWTDLTASARTRNASIPYMTAPQVEKGTKASSEESLYRSDIPPPALTYDAAPRVARPKDVASNPVPHSQYQEFAVLDYNDMPRFTTEGDNDDGFHQKLSTETPTTATTRKGSTPYSVAQGLSFSVPRVAHHQVPTGFPAVNERPPNVTKQSSAAVPAYEPSEVPLSQSDRTLFTPSPVSSAQRRGAQQAQRYSTRRGAANVPHNCPEAPQQPQRLSLRTVGMMPQYHAGQLHAPSVATPDEGPSPVQPFSPDNVLRHQQLKEERAYGFPVQPAAAQAPHAAAIPMTAQYHQPPPPAAIAPSWAQPQAAPAAAVPQQVMTSPYSATQPTGPAFPVSAISPDGNTLRHQYALAQRQIAGRQSVDRGRQSVDRGRQSIDRSMAMPRASLDAAAQQQPQKQPIHRRAATVDEDFAPCDLAGLQALAGRDYPRY